MGKMSAEQVTEGIDLSHHTILVTGGTNGLGKETVRVLAKGGAHVFMQRETLQLQRR
jgi:retinol dehydrogenase-12